MTKKDYELIASEIKRLHKDYSRRLKKALDVIYYDDHEYMCRYHGQADAMYDIAHNLREAFRKQNPKFNEDKFTKACGVQD